MNISENSIKILSHAFFQESFITTHWGWGSETQGAQGEPRSENSDSRLTLLLYIHKSIEKPTLNLEFAS